MADWVSPSKVVADLVVVSGFLACDLCKFLADFLERAVVTAGTIMSISLLASALSI